MVGSSYKFSRPIRIRWYLNFRCEREGLFHRPPHVIRERGAAAKGCVNAFALLVRKGYGSRLISLKFDIVIKGRFPGEPYGGARLSSGISFIWRPLRRLSVAEICA